MLVTAGPVACENTLVFLLGVAICFRAVGYPGLGEVAVLEERKNGVRRYVIWMASVKLVTLV